MTDSSTAHAAARRQAASPARRSSCRAAAAASAWRSPCARRATAPTSPCSPRPTPRIPSSRARCTPPREQIRAAGGKALPIVGDVRNDDDITGAVLETQGEFGGIDIVVNNASVIDLSGSMELAGEEVRPHAGRQRARDVPALARGRPDPARQCQPAHPVAVAAAEPRRRNGSALTPATPSRSTA